MLDGAEREHGSIHGALALRSIGVLRESAAAQSVPIFKRNVDSPLVDLIKAGWSDALAYL